MNKEKDSISRQRNSSIELLRIISMVGVIVLHYNNAGMGGGFKYAKEGSINQYYLYFTENLFVCVVNLFILISAYFLAVNNERKMVKIVELIVQVIVFRLVFYIVNIIGGTGSLTLKGVLGSLLPINYFAILYSVVYILSPYINIMLDNLDRKKFQKLLITLGIIFSVWTILVDFLENATGLTIIGLSTVGMYGSQYGYTIVNFLLIYFIGAYIRRNDIRISSAKAICGIIVVFIIMYISAIMEHVLGFGGTTTWNYNNPFVILFAVFIFLLFLNIQFQSRLINEMAKGAFTCFLFHVEVISYFNVEEVVNGNILLLIIHQFGVAIILYAISYIVYKVYYLCSHWFIKLLASLCNKINISL